MRRRKKQEKRPRDICSTKKTNAAKIIGFEGRGEGGMGVPGVETDLEPII